MSRIETIGLATLHLADCRDVVDIAGGGAWYVGRSL